MIVIASCAKQSSCGEVMFAMGGFVWLWFLCLHGVSVVTDDVYLLAWIASSQTAAPRNDGVGGHGLLRCKLPLLAMTCLSPSLRACEAIRRNVYVVKSDMRRKVVSWLAKRGANKWLESLVYRAKF